MSTRRFVLMERHRVVSRRQIQNPLNRIFSITVLQACRQKVFSLLLSKVRWCRAHSIRKAEVWIEVSGCFLAPQSQRGKILVHTRRSCCSQCRTHCSQICYFQGQGTWISGTTEAFILDSFLVPIQEQTFLLKERQKIDSITHHTWFSTIEAAETLGRICRSCRMQLFFLQLATKHQSSPLVKLIRHWYFPHNGHINVNIQSLELDFWTIACSFLDGRALKTIVGGVNIGQ